MKAKKKKKNKFKKEIVFFLQLETATTVRPFIDKCLLIQALPFNCNTMDEEKRNIN